MSSSPPGKSAMASLDYCVMFGTGKSTLSWSDQEKEYYAIFGSDADTAAFCPSPQPKKAIGALIVVCLRDLRRLI
jgi:hypothetical protein